MLTERLTKRKLFEEADKELRQKAISLLDVTVCDLVGAMSSIERDEVMSREEVENVVISMLQHYEVMLYSMDNEEFGDWQNETMIRRRYWAMREGEDDER